MPKRGETLPYRVRFEWTNGAAGVIRARTEEAAEAKVAQLERHARRRADLGMTITLEWAPARGIPAVLDTRTIAVTDVVEDL